MICYVTAPGIISSVIAAPPNTWRRSKTQTRLPAVAKYAAYNFYAIYFGFTNDLQRLDRYAL
jgi:hypothetical protein